jgi:divinyl protochlorophyllide a 8-vinyl-reductase
MTAHASARIGPNAIIQMGEALAARHEGTRAERIYSRAGLLPYLAQPPTAMVHEGEVARLFRAVSDEPDPAMARDLFADAGRRTGRYILSNRIPAVARFLLPLLPRGLALKILLKAISKHAWTFAGTGRVSYTTGSPASITIADNPIATSLGCVWHAAVFETIFGTLIRGQVRVRETCCHAGADHRCTFEIS